MRLPTFPLLSYTPSIVFWVFF
uniref:Uncharacterized protein n=1 Tax=Arundo donax TaxID=35708 RepID=A0A0A9A5R8_ARUDO